MPKIGMNGQFFFVHHPTYFVDSNKTKRQWNNQETHSKNYEIRMVKDKEKAAEQKRAP